VRVFEKKILKRKGKKQDTERHVRAYIVRSHVERRFQDEPEKEYKIARG